VGRFYYGRFLQLLGIVLIVAGGSGMFNSVFGAGIGLILLGITPVVREICFEEAVE